MVVEVEKVERDGDSATLANARGGHVTRHLPSLVSVVAAWTPFVIRSRSILLKNYAFMYNDLDIFKTNVFPAVHFANSH